MQRTAVPAYRRLKQGKAVSIRALALLILASYRHVRGRTAMFLNAYIATAVPESPRRDR
ncbi:hypothetical protein ALP58_102218 [Pseudomonas savastanoi]|uniref:Uncharacterized protein n=2 Tax=Pseudomonas syringae group TaxID=136849 RepID=A0A0P9N5S3_PSESX|nr:hypothetical protein ALO79_100575 [Pseudomonas syringae pv. castaneae]RMS85458.1 hypothetical protein ALP58_102218 [Pseudomonas savastanoi]